MAAEALWLCYSCLFIMSAAYGQAISHQSLVDHRVLITLCGATLYLLTTFAILLRPSDGPVIDREYQSTRPKYRSSPLCTVGFLYLSLGLAAAAYLTITNPHFGWDSLQYWLWRSTRAISYASSGILEPHPRWSFLIKHPPVYPNLLAFMAEVMRGLGKHSFLLGCAGFLTITFSVWAFPASPGRMPMILIGLLTILGLPLPENVLVIGGYAEQLMIPIATLIGILGAWSLTRGTRGFANWAFYSSAVSLTLIKDIGFVYSIIIIFSFHCALNLKGKKTKNVYISIAAITLLISATFVLIGLLDVTVQLGRHSIVSDALNPLAAAKSIMHALFVNSSFSVATSIIIILFLLAPEKASPDQGALFGFLTIFMSATLLWLLITYSGVWLAFSLPDSDTTLTRVLSIFVTVGFSAALFSFFMSILKSNFSPHSQFLLGDKAI